MAFSAHHNLVDVNVVPLIGGSSRVGGEYQLNEMVRMFADETKVAKSCQTFSDMSDEKREKPQNHCGSRLFGGSMGRI